MVVLVYLILDSNSLNLFHTEINSTIVDQLLTKYCNEPFNSTKGSSYLLNEAQSVIAPVTIVGASAK